MTTYQLARMREVIVRWASQREGRGWNCRFVDVAGVFGRNPDNIGTLELRAGGHEWTIVRDFPFSEWPKTVRAMFDEMHTFSEGQG